MPFQKKIVTPPLPVTTKPMAKTVQFYKGFDLMGAQASTTYKKADIEIYDWGVKITSKKNKRVIRVYASNIQGLEELPMAPQNPLIGDELA
jgi:hypothetical protein